ncbi:MAG: uroporphyrinogen decarboxylase [OCS116 cluster bacterium]|nr:uroporphyrinogen decarboxylase [OCS116 cluster bacterium]
MILNTFSSHPPSIPPIWFMRQAGRYLPEYLKVREHAGSFLDLCYNPEFATIVTMQPIDKFDFDAAILFSDILVVPHALGMQVSFVKGEGPKLVPLTNQADIDALNLNNFHQKIDKVYQAVASIRKALPKDKDLIGFCGAPWTLLTYMLGGVGSVDQKIGRLFSYNHPQLMKQLLSLLSDVLADYLFMQAKAGAQVLKIFDSWAGNLADDEFDQLVVEPTHNLVKKLKAKLKAAGLDHVKILAFPRGAGEKYPYYAKNVDIDGLAFDTSVDLEWIRDHIDANITLQGNLDPLLLVAGGERLDRRTNHICDVMQGRRFIFNLGHGIIPETPQAHVHQVIKTIRSR